MVMGCWELRRGGGFSWIVDCSWFCVGVGSGFLLNYGGHHTTRVVVNFGIVI